MRALRQRIAEHQSANGAEKQLARPRKRRVRKAPVATHRAFVPMLAIWGVALGAGAVLVLPASIVARIAAATGMQGLGGSTGFVLAALAGFVLGAITLALAFGFRRARIRSAPTGSLASVAARSFEPIDPASELGSESLDAPIEQIPFDTEDAEGGAASQPVPGEPAGQEIDLGEHETDVPRELDLAEFAALSGRNAVWVEEEGAQVGSDDLPCDPEPEVELTPEADPQPESLPEPEPEPESVNEPTPTPAPPARLSAIEKLRQTPPSDLSLIQMVERFAAALHERQDADNENAGPHASLRRDAALAEALKALTVLSETGLEIEAELGQVQVHANGNAASGAQADALRDTTSELRDALSKLQTLRGAA